MDEDAARKPIDKPRRAVIFATLGILVIMGLAFFIGTVVVPLWQVQAALSDPCITRDEVVKKLGGPERTARRLATYLRLPHWMKTNRVYATDLLGRCGKPALPTLITLARDKAEDIRVRLKAVNHLHWLEPVEHLPSRAGAGPGIRFTDTDVIARRIYTALPGDAEIERIIKSVCKANGLQYGPPLPHD